MTSWGSISVSKNDYSMKIVEWSSHDHFEALCRHLQCGTEEGIQSLCEVSVSELERRNFRIGSSSATHPTGSGITSGWEADSRAAGYEFKNLLWTAKLYFTRANHWTLLGKWAVGLRLSYWVVTLFTQHYQLWSMVTVVPYWGVALFTQHYELEVDLVFNDDMCTADIRQIVEEELIMKFAFRNAKIATKCHIDCVCFLLFLEIFQNICFSFLLEGFLSTYFV